MSGGQDGRRPAVLEGWPKAFVNLGHGRRGRGVQERTGELGQGERPRRGREGDPTGCGGHHKRPTPNSSGNSAASRTEERERPAEIFAGGVSHPVGDGGRQRLDAIRPPRRYRTTADSGRVDHLAGDLSAFLAWIRRSTRSPREPARPLGTPTSPRRLPRRSPGASGTAGNLARTASRGDIPGAQIVQSITRGIE